MSCLEPAEPGQVRNVLKKLLLSFGPIDHPVVTNNQGTEYTREHRRRKNQLRNPLAFCFGKKKKKKNQLRMKLSWQTASLISPKPRVQPAVKCMWWPTPAIPALGGLRIQGHLHLCGKSIALDG